MPLTVLAYAVFVNRSRSIEGLGLALLAVFAGCERSVAPSPEPDQSLMTGYMGHDQFAVVENVLVQRFPIYREGDVNAKPTGGTRQIQYRLVPGEAGWILRVDRVVEY